MKNLYVSLFLIVVLATGCAGNSSNVSKADNEIETLARELGQASLNDDKELMVELGNKMLAKNVIPKEILIQGNCHIVNYSVNSVDYKVEVCK